MYVGETVHVRVKPSSAGQVIKEGTVVAEFWGPDVNPMTDQAARDNPAATALCSFDGHQSWECRVDTTGWAPGIWTVRGKVDAYATPDEQAKGWAFSTFTLNP